MDDHLGARKNLKRHKKIPIYIVENHHDVIPFIYRNIGSKHLPLKGSILLHFDSHPDMLIPTDMPADYVFDKEKLYENLDIANWIMPAAYAGHFDHLIWLKPPWAHQIEDSSQSFNIGRDKVEGTIKLDCKEAYFLSECLYRNSRDLEDVKSIQLDIATIGNKLHDSTDDLDKIRSWILKTDAEIVLDIDLDFFSTGNPFSRMYEKADLYGRLKDIYFYEPPEEKDDQIIIEVVKNRKKQISMLYDIFKHLNDNRCMPEEHKSSELWSKVDSLRRTVLAHYKDEDIDWLLIHDAGCTCDESGLPDHVSNMEELQAMFSSFKDFLDVLPKIPVIVTISRSTEDDYTPFENVQLIQNKVVELLNEKFQCDEPLLSYLTTASS